jgi:hypothetical protein
MKLGKFSLVTNNFYDIESLISLNYENYINLLKKEKNLKRYGDFIIKSK